MPPPGNPKRKTARPEVPEPGDPDRKRLLNVLAQRRYRKRRREKLATLEAQVRGDHSNASPSGQHASLPSPPTSEENNVMLESHTLDQLDGPSQLHNFADELLVVSETDSLPMPPFTNLEISTYFPVHQSLGTNESLDPLDLGLDPFSLDNMVSMSPPPTFSHPSYMSTSHGPSYTSSAFMDDATLEIPLLKLLTAGTQIAQLLGCMEGIFEPTASHILGPVTDAVIPPCLRPTPAQQRIPHHPFIDILPWPSVRTKLILAFSQPSEIRPPSARGPMAITSLMTDMDDEVDGCRIAGEDGLDEKNWEVGQVFFSHWWWAIDRQIIERSNELRRKRGAGRLQLLAD